nr:MAG TPA: hypothetical protein [Bacteriophage sp.]
MTTLCLFNLVPVQPPRSNGKTTLFTKQTYAFLAVVQNIALLLFHFSID